MANLLNKSQKLPKATLKVVENADSSEETLDNFTKEVLPMEFTLEDFSRVNLIDPNVNEEIHQQKKKLYERTFKSRTIKIKMEDLLFLHTVWVANLTNPPTFFSMIKHYETDGNTVYIPVSNLQIVEPKIKQSGPVTTLALRFLHDALPLPMKLTDLISAVRKETRLNESTVLGIITESQDMRITDGWVSIWY